MNEYKSVERIINPPHPHMVGDGFRVHNFFPGEIIGTKRMSPFFLMDYNSRFYFPPTEKPRGVGVHPHRGFETVTLALSGRVAHHDSSGNSGIIGEGDVQWMTAGSGVLHKEYHEQEFSKTGGWFQMIQLWVNLPAKNKMTPPAYQELLDKNMGKFSLPGNGGTVHIIAGSLEHVKGPASTFTPIQLWRAELEEGTEWEFSLPSHYNTGILVAAGSVTINGKADAPADHFVLFENDGEKIRIKSREKSTLIVLSGEPIDEPIAQYGPFLMNTHEELQQAFIDFNTGKFGTLADE